MRLVAMASTTLIASLVFTIMHAVHSRVRRQDPIHRKWIPIAITLSIRRWHG
jgi:hypothetical protein